MSTKTLLFAGPSLGEITEENIKALGIELCEPVKRNSIKEICDTSNTVGNMIVADGYFHGVLSVSHREIREAIDQGWHVWGCSSMGAIRASEMKDLGMIGYGYVYQKFASDPDFTDDEVALLHASEAPYISISEPLVNIRFFLENLVNEDLISNETSQKVIDELKSMWYGDRTLGLLKKMLLKYTDHQEVYQNILNFSKFRIKSIDLENILKEQPW